MKTDLKKVFDAVTIQTLEDIDRIKKPSKNAFDICRLFTTFIKILKDNSSSSSGCEDLDDWNLIR